MFVVDIDKHSTSLYTLAKDASIHKKYFFDGLLSMQGHIDIYADTGVFLVHESYCRIRSYTVHITVDTPFTITQYKELLVEKTQLFFQETMSEYHATTVLLYSNGIWGESALAGVLGRTGTISLSWHIFAPRPELLFQCKALWGHPSVRHNRALLFPRMYYCMQLLATMLHRDDFVLLHVGDTDSSLYTIDHGWYASIEYFPIGQDLLMQVATEQEVQKYIFTDEYVAIERNPVAKKLLQEGLTFYCSQLARLVAAIPGGTTIVLSEPFVRHPLFMDTFQERLSVMSSAFLMPFSPTILSNYFYTRQQQELPVWAYYKLASL